MRYLRLVVRPFLIASSLLISCASAQWYVGYQDMLAQVNQMRSQNGKAPLCNSAKLMSSALSHSNYQASVGSPPTHNDTLSLLDRFTTQGFPVIAAAENVGLSGSTNIGEIMQAWAGDSGHLGNILGDYQYFGSAAVQGPDGQYYWTQHFGTSSDPNEPCMDGSMPFIPTPQSQSTNQMGTQSPPGNQSITGSLYQPPLAPLPGASLPVAPLPLTSQPVAPLPKNNIATNFTASWPQPVAPMQQITQQVQMGLSPNNLPNMARINMLPPYYTMPQWPLANSNPYYYGPSQQTRLVCSQFGCYTQFY